MTPLVKITLAVALTLSFGIPFLVFLHGERTKKRFKTALGFNLALFLGTFAVTTVFLIVTGSAEATAASVEEAATTASGLATGLGYLAAALVTGLSCIGGGIAVASAASAALGAISEDQSILGKSILFVGLAEGVALYGLIISFMILGKL